MIRLFINGLAASAGGGLTYLRNLILQLASHREVEATVLLSRSLRPEFSDFSNLSFLEFDGDSSTVWRFLWEQTSLPRIVRDCGADVLISTGNFALRKSPVPQILLSRNSLYLSQDFLHDLRERREYALLLDTRLKGWVARRSIYWADVTVAPTQAFAVNLGAWSGAKVEAVHHGFDRNTFLGSLSPLTGDVQRELDSASGCLRLLFVSHYNYYRNFETLFRALPLIRDTSSRPVKLFLTCRLRENTVGGGYRPQPAAALVRNLGVSDSIVELGPIPYRELHHLYSACHLYVTPAYAESFAHPLVEAMSCGLPIVASDLAVHREICGSAAQYFSHRSPQQLADRVAEVANTPALAAQLGERGRLRSQDFSWQKHVRELLSIAARLADKGGNVRQLQAAS